MTDATEDKKPTATEVEVNKEQPLQARELTYAEHLAMMEGKGLPDGVSNHYDDHIARLERKPWL